MYESHGPLKDAVVRALHGVSRQQDSEEDDFAVKLGDMNVVKTDMR